MTLARRTRLAATAGAIAAAAITLSAGTAAFAQQTLVVSPTTAAPRVLPGTVPHLAALSSPLGATDPTLRLHLDAALRLPDQAGLDSYVERVYQPGSADFHRFLDPGSFGRRFGAPQPAVDMVVSALQRLGFHVTAPTPNHLMVGFDGTVAQVERAFAVRVDDFHLSTGQSFHANVNDITLPASLSGWVSGIAGIDNSAPPRSHLARARTSAALPVIPAPAPQNGGATPCPQANTGYTAPVYASAYDFNGLYAAGYHGEGMTAALVEFDDYHDSNVAGVESCYGLTTPVQRRLVDGGTGAAPQGGEVEDMADITTLLEMLPNLQKLYVYVAPITGIAEIDLYNAFATDMLAPVLSASWGNCEELNSQADNHLFAAIAEEAAAQGQQIFDASGDSGAVDCRGFPVPTMGSISVEQEASVPWITGVGGTNLPVQSVATTAGPRPEFTWNDGGAGGGGVSTLWTMPSWQAALPSAVSAPGASGAPCGAPAGHLCRAVPDISANADPSFGQQTNTQFQGNTIGSPGYSIYCATTNCWLPDLLGLPVAPQPAPPTAGWWPIGGSSLSTPLTAAAAVLWDQEAKAKGLSGLGLLNPPLYAVAADPTKYANDFHDITSDSNDAEYDSTDCPTGCNPNKLYQAGPGYDMASGLGSYDAANLGADLVALAAHTEVSPDVVSVYGYLGGPATTAPVVVSSGYTGAAFTATSDAPWLHAASGKAPSALQWSVDPTGLSAGTHTGHVTLNGPGGSAALTVSYQVTQRAVAHLSSTALTFHEDAIDSNGKPTAPTCGSNLWNDELKYAPSINSGTATPVDPQSRTTLTISNAGPAGSVLHWSAFFYSDASGWLSQDLIPNYDPNNAATPVTTVSPPQVATDGTLGSGDSFGLKLAAVANANRLGGFPQMNQGTYHGILLLRDLADPAFTLPVPATLVLGDGSATPTVSVAPAAITLALDPAKQQTVNLTLSDPAADGGCGYVYSAQSQAPWVALPAPTYSGGVGNAGGTSASTSPVGTSNDTGTGNGTIPVTIDTTGLTPGVHHTTIAIQSMDAEPNPITVPVDVTVTGALPVVAPSTTGGGTTTVGNNVATAGNASLPNTSAPTPGAVVATLGWVLIGGGVVLARRRRRRAAD
jgi:LPXTG-motif cell wall-anchored protein